MLSSWRMYEMHLALFLKAGCDNGAEAGRRERAGRAPWQGEEGAPLPTTASKAQSARARATGGAVEQGPDGHGESWGGAGNGGRARVP
jgi:hypothetical protein